MTRRLLVLALAFVLIGISGITISRSWRHAMPPLAATLGPREVAIFFDQGCDLDQVAQDRLSEWASNAKSHGISKVHIVGQANAGGLSEQSRKLALCQANAVKDGLARGGLPAEVMDTSAAETEPSPAQGSGNVDNLGNRVTIDPQQ